MRIRVLLADDHRLLAELLKLLLEPEFEVIGSVDNGRDVVETALKLNPDLIVLDVSLARLNGLDAARQVKRARPSTKLIFLTMSQDPDLAAEALRIGASGFVVKSCAASELLGAVRAVLKGRTFVSPTVSEAMAGSFLHFTGRRRPVRSLTLRQREVLQLLAEGFTMKEVGQKLKITPRTVAYHKYAMMEQLQIRNSAALVQFAIKSSLVSVQAAVA
jgi:DNA-binding NarL/FixJ family response regulator